MSHLYGCRSTSFIDTDWALFIKAMMMSRFEPGSHVHLSPGRAALAGVISEGENFSYDIATDLAGLEVIRGLAQLMHYPLSDYATEPFIHDASPTQLQADMATQLEADIDAMERVDEMEAEFNG